MLESPSASAGGTGGTISVLWVISRCNRNVYIENYLNND